MISPYIDEVKPYLQRIRELPSTGSLKREDLLNNRFLMKTEGDLSMYYAPHNEVINTGARIVIVGITPGWSQMKTAFEAACQMALDGTSLEVMLQYAKRSAGFAGSMRHNLCCMLDELGIASEFGLNSSAELFDDRTDLLHTTSIIKYPVFKNRKNYTGHTPKMERIAMLKPYIEEVFPKELNLIKDDYLLIPLGKAVGETLKKLTEMKVIRADRCLFGFPHPSGANGHRISQFAEEKNQLRALVQEWSGA